MDSGCPTGPARLVAYKTTETMIQPTRRMDDELRELIEGLTKEQIQELANRLKADAAFLESDIFMAYYVEHLRQHGGDAGSVWN